MKSKFFLSAVAFLIVIVLLTSCDRTPEHPSHETADPQTQEQTVTPSETPAADETTAEAVTEAQKPFVWDVDTDHYTIRNSNGLCFITFKEGYIVTDSEKQSCQNMEIYFNSMQDMVQSFAGNQLTQAQATVIQASFPSAADGYTLWNTEALYDARTPDGVTVSSVALHGQYYDLFLESDVFSYASISYNTEEYIQWSKDLLYVWSEGMTIISEEDSTFDGVPCRIVEYKGKVVTYRDIFIETEVDGLKTDTVIRYRLEDLGEQPERVSATAPWRVLMYCENNGSFYDVTIHEMTETPTYEWLSSFGLTPYVPCADGGLAVE